MKKLMKPGPAISVFATSSLAGIAATICRRERARVGARGLRESHRYPGREVAVRDVAAALDRRIGCRRVADRARGQRGDRVVHQFFDEVFQARNSILSTGSIDLGRIDVERPAQRPRRLQRGEDVDPRGEKGLQRATRRRLDQELRAMPPGATRKRRGRRAEDADPAARAAGAAAAAASRNWYTSGRAGRVGAQQREVRIGRPPGGAALLERERGEALVASRDEALEQRMLRVGRLDQRLRRGDRRGPRDRRPARSAARAVRSRGSRHRTGPGRPPAPRPASRSGSRGPWSASGCRAGCVRGRRPRRRAPLPCRRGGG